MSKRIEINGKFYRMRRGKLVEIPSRWVGKITTQATKRKRKQTKKCNPNYNRRQKDNLICKEHVNHDEKIL